MHQFLRQIRLALTRSPCQLVVQCKKFQSTPPCGGRPIAAAPFVHVKGCFNPRPRVGGDNQRIYSQVTGTGFNPRPRVGGDQSGQCSQSNSGRVSIHAPVWGATADDFDPADQISVSIHAPVWGATDVIEHFGGDEDVSIHAPVWGATCLNHDAIEPTKFQSTPPCGGRLPAICISAGRSCFNPRPRVGGDKHDEEAHKDGTVFQSTPPCGGRQQGALTLRPDMAVSIHAPVWGATSKTCFLLRKR